MPKKALLVDTNRGSYPFINVLHREGWHITSIGSSSDAPLVTFCDHYIKADYSQVSELQRIIDNGGYCAVIPGCTDASYLACAQISQTQRRGIDSLDVVDKLFQKDALRKLASELQITQPRQLTEFQALQDISVIVKPVDGFSGGGITLLRRPTLDSLHRAIEDASLLSPSEHALIEEFVEGQLYSHSAFLLNQMIDIDFFVQEDCTDHPFAVDTSCIALDLAEDVKVQVRNEIERLAHHLLLVDGLLHTQFLLRDGTAYLLEITRRHPGDLYGLLIEYSTGFDYSTRYLNSFLPNPILPRDVQQTIRPVIRHTITAGPGLDLWSLQFHESLHIRQLIPLTRAGDHLDSAPRGRAAILFVESQDMDAHLATYKSFIEHRAYSFGI